MAKSRVTYEDLFDKKLQSEINGLKKSIAQLTDEYKKIIQQQASSTTVTRKATESNKGLKEAERELLKQEQRAEKMQKALIKEKNNLNKANIKAQEQRRQYIASVKQEIKAEKEARGSLAAKTRELKKAEDAYNRAAPAAAKKLAPAVRKLRNEVNKLNAAVGNNRGKVGSYFKEFLRGAASMATMYLSFQGLTRLISNVTGIMIGFEKTMSGVKAITGATDEEMIKLSEDAKRLGSETNKTSQEVGQLQIEFGKLGFSTQEILDATEATVLLSQATGEDLASSAAVAGATVRGFGLEASETGRIVDVMAASFTSSALNLSRFSESMKYVAPVAKSVGISVEQTTAYLSKLADAGIHGSQAGTALRMVMLKMAQAGMTGAKGFAKMASKATGLAEANDEVGQRAATALLVMSEQSEELETLTEQYNNASGAAKEMAETQMDNLAGSIEILKSAWEGLVLEFTQGDGVIRRLVDSLTSFVQFLSGANSEIKEYDFNKNILSQTTEKYNSQLIKEKTETDLLFRMIKKTNPESKKRNNLVAELQKKYPDYITNINLEKAGVEDIAKAQEEYNNQIERRMIIAAKEEATSELLDKSTEKIKEKMKAEMQLLKIQARREQIYENGDRTEQESRELEIMKLNETVLQGIIAGADIYIEDLKNQMQEIDGYYSDMIRSRKKTEEGGNNEQVKATEKKSVELLEIERDLWESRLKINGAGEMALWENERFYTEKIIEARKLSGDITEKEAETLYNNLLLKHREYLKNREKIESEGIYEPSVDDLTGKPGSVDVEIEPGKTLLQRLGLDEDNLNSIKTGYQSVYDLTRQHYDDMRELADLEVERAKTETDAKRDNLTEQMRLQEQGAAFDIAQAQRELSEAKKVQEEAEAQQMEALKRQQALQSIEQATNLITASTNIIQTSLGQPYIYLPLLATMWGTFFAQKVKSNKVVQYADGGDWDIGGGSHKSGNDTSLGVHGERERRVQRGEKVAVFNDRANRHYPELSEWIKSVNRLDFNPGKSELNIINFSTDKLERETSKIAKNTSEKVYVRNGKTIVKRGNTTYRYV